MKTLHFDCFAGISGDMALGALVDLGVDPDALRHELEKLGLNGWKLEFHRDERGGIGGTHAVVDLGEQTEHSAHGTDSTMQYRPHDPQRMALNPKHDHHDEHSHNSWKDIRALIEQSSLTGGAKKRALGIFTRIAEAEAQVHGSTVEDVRFHEVGAMDSIIDVVGSAICLDMLKPDRITCSEVELGGGTVKCAHGILPVPAPATLILVRGMPVKTGGFNKEMTTPTGAAILAASVDEFCTAGNFRELQTGYGIGTRKMDRPNFLRVSLREEAANAHGATAVPDANTPWNTEELVLIEANIDDMSGEALGFLMERLFEAGALDVTLSPCVMKKSRPGTVVSVLGSPQQLDVLRRTMFQKSNTIGFRETPVHRLSLSREASHVGGGFGDVRQKTVFFGGEPLRSKLEYDDRARVARERGISLEAAEQLIKTATL
ncbi:UPF0272 protein [Spirochaetia bacterium]|nr:UPF0272 protein [Spirochaetia bacterium]